ncbi:MAG: TrkA family potassium uptake protein [Chloroflexi bacterium]|nr:TrkA family potassium uptake protein [Chloroflexota bacterium]
MASLIVIAGLGRFGSVLAQALTQSGYEVLGIDRRQEPVRTLADSVSKTVQGDATSAGFWNDLPVKNADIGVVAFGSSVEANVLTAVLMRRVGLKRIIAKSSSELHTDLLRAIGIETIIEPASESALRLAHTLGTPVQDYLEVTADYGIGRISVAEAYKGTSVEELYNRRKSTVLAIRRGQNVVLQPKDTEMVKGKDTLFLAGADEDLRFLAQSLGQAGGSGQ